MTRNTTMMYFPSQPGYTMLFWRRKMLQLCACQQTSKDAWLRDTSDVSNPRQAKRTHKQKPRQRQTMVSFGLWQLARSLDAGFKALCLSNSRILCARPL
eukprot:m.69476 g.69476  ORF g.69476 m.69476 type:complete len:99 (-) comp13737_c2_seq2:963-1259(-)